MQLERIVGVGGCLFLLIGSQLEGQNVVLDAVIEGNAGASWQVDRADLEKNGHSIEAHLRLTNVTNASIPGARFYAQYVDGTGRECFSLMFSEEVTSDGERNGSVQPRGSPTMYSGTGSIFPATLPKAVHIFSLKPVDAREPLQWSETDEIIDVPPTIMGGSAGEQVIRSDIIDPNQYLGLILVTIDTQGAVKESRIVNAASDALREGMQVFLKSLRFNPPMRSSHASTSPLFILLVRQDSKVFTDDTSLPWEAPWVADAVRNVASGDVVPALTELAFDVRSSGVDSGSGLEYFPLGSDWCPGLFTWTTDPMSGKQTRKWDPGWVARDTTVTPRKSPNK
jgi:hypothetical protein